MTNQEQKAVIEGLIFASGDEGISAKEIASILKMNKQAVELLIHELRVDIKEHQRGIQIVKMAQVYVMTSLDEHAPYLEVLASVPHRAKLSRAAIETLAIIAYRQPITRLGIEEIRGVKSDRLIQTLQRKGLIQSIGRAEGAGRPILYGTTKAFLMYFGLNDLDELPAAHSIFNWQEWEADKKELFQRLGINPEENEQTDDQSTKP